MPRDLWHSLSPRAEESVCFIITVFNKNQEFPAVSQEFYIPGNFIFPRNFRERCTGGISGVHSQSVPTQL